MIKKALSYIFIVFGLVVLGASTSRKAMQYISDKRDNENWWGTYREDHGDLVSMCYLDFVKKFSSPHDYHFKYADYHGPKNTVLYLHGDSYTRHLNDSAFAGVCVYKYIDRNHGYYYHLDTTKRNVLVIEISERYFRDYFEDLRLLDNLSDSTEKKSTSLYHTAFAHKVYASFLSGFDLDGVLFNKYINQNLQCNLFNYNVIMPMFESKAALNYYIFNRASGDVVISQDRQFLFLKETVTGDDIGSSYVPLNTGDIQHLVNNLNIIYDHYISKGFSEVYLSIIPNSATIMQPEHYNLLIPMIQDDPALKMQVIDIYSVFKRSPRILYLPGDTHWNDNGRQQWLDLVNKKLTGNIGKH